MLSNTGKEIANQQASWRETIPRTIEQWSKVMESLRIEPHTHFLFVGSGTSLYLARSAAQSFQEITGHICLAVPSSEIFLSPASTVPSTVPVVAFVISRSGATSEAVIAADSLGQSCPNVTVVAVTCHESTKLERIADFAIRLPHAAELSVVMTQSFTSMLLALQVVAGSVASDHGLLDELARLPHLLVTHAARFEDFAWAMGSNRSNMQFIYLGLGAYAGLAEEGSLKLKEMTQTPCEAYNTLEFRHGPISIVTPGTAVVVLQGQREESYIADLLAELKRFGATVATIGPSNWENADTTLQLPGDLTDVSRSLLYVPPMQLIALNRALEMGLDPDLPRNLNQVVVLPGVDEL